jgi:cobalamin-dependent methionine synthase I
MKTYFQLFVFRVMKKAVAYLEPFFEEEKRKAQLGTYQFN